MMAALSTVLITIVECQTGRVLSIASGSVVRGPDAACYILTSEHNLKSRKGKFDATAQGSSAMILVAVNDSVSNAPKHRFRAAVHPNCVNAELDLVVLHLVEAISTRPERGVLEQCSQTGKKRVISKIDITFEQSIGHLFGLLYTANIGVVDSVGLGCKL